MTIITTTAQAQDLVTEGWPAGLTTLEVLVQNDDTGTVLRDWSTASVVERPADSGRYLLPDYLFAAPGHYSHVWRDTASPTFPDGSAKVTSEQVIVGLAQSSGIPAGDLGGLDDWIARRGSDFTDDDQAQRVLDAAAALVRDAAGGQWITAVTEDAQLLNGAGRGILLLPQVPVTNVRSVVLTDTNTTVDPTTYRWTPEGELVRVGSPLGFPTCTWPWGWQNVRCTYDHGYDPVPESVLEVVYGLAERMLAVNPGGREIVAEALGQWSSQYAPLTAVGLTALEAMAIGRLRVR